MRRNIFSIPATAILSLVQAQSSPPINMTEPEIMEFLEEIADGFRIWPEAPLYHRPDELNLKYETVTFPSEDGVPLEGWFFPCNGSDKIIIMNHPRLFNRAGLPSHIEPWNTLTAPLGNNFDVNFIPDYKILHDAGYNVLTHDFRNYGMSGRGNNVLYSGGRYGSYDVIGALRYIRKRKDTKDMTIGLFPRCMGGSATFFAMGTHPEEFKDIRTIVFPQPISANMSSKVTLQTAGIDLDYLRELDDMVYWRTSLHLEEYSLIPWARNVNIPTYMFQVRNDLATHWSDVQGVFDAIPAEDKELFWINGTTRRWDGYLHFQRHPDAILKWLERWMNYVLDGSNLELEIISASFLYYSGI